ncbi:hypothetical protein [Streptomyces sp. NPDC048825]|uniref:hypothetical protein n=1 Tax=Streptomyces sp. NPDC048825 TaxID=3365592 RepID=UPI0037164274
MTGDSFGHQAQFGPPWVAAYRAVTEVSRITEPSDGPRGMLNAAMRTYCRLLAANTGPARALVVESVACPAIRTVRVECLTASSQLMAALAAERRPDRPVPPMAGTAAIGAVCICRPPPSRRARPCPR